ncbi:MAG: glycosyltransferase family 4 protein [Bryobacteraceae bacterium]
MRKPKLAFLTNLVAPSKVSLFAHLASHFDLRILHGALEPNRTSWKERNVEGVQVRRVAGWQFSLPKRYKGEEFDRWFLHIEPGYFLELLRDRPDAVVTGEMGFRTLMALTYGTLFRKPVWIFWGGTLHTERNVSGLRTMARRMVARWAKRWISYGQTSTEYLRSLDIPNGRILQIQNTVDESWFGPAVEPCLELQPKPVLLHVGQMIGRKGIPEFLRAAAHLKREGLKFSIALVGSGPDRERVQQLTNDLHLRDVQFYPAQSPENMPSFYRSADVLIFPTMEDVWGLVANEAVLSGLPVLCSRYAGCAPELFDRDSIFDPADQQDFIEALRRAVSGCLPRPNPSRLRRTQEVSKMLIDALLASLPGVSVSGPDPS